MAARPACVHSPAASLCVHTTHGTYLRTILSVCSHPHGTVIYTPLDTLSWVRRFGGGRRRGGWPACLSLNPAMGCGASRVPPTMTRVDSPELAQNMKGAGHLPLYVSTRKLDPEAFHSQRVDATTEAQNHSSRRRPSRMALPAVQPGATVPEPPRKRMSRFGTQDRKDMIKGIETMSSKDSSQLPPKGLEARLATLGLQMEVMEGDGNCQFRAAAFNLFGAQSLHAVVRQSAVAQMKKHHDFFGIYFEGADEFKRYLREMGRSRTWGDELTLRAIVEAYGCEAHVITSEEANWCAAHTPTSGARASPSSHCSAPFARACCAVQVPRLLAGDRGGARPGRCLLPQGPPDAAAAQTDLPLLVRRRCTPARHRLRVAWSSTGALKRTPSSRPRHSPEPVHTTGCSLSPLDGRALISILVFVL